MFLRREHVGQADTGAQKVLCQGRDFVHVGPEIVCAVGGWTLLFHYLVSVSLYQSKLFSGIGGAALGMVAGLARRVHIQSAAGLDKT